MTTIIAVETPTGVEIACDSQATGGDKIQMEQSKVFHNNGALYGVAGLALLANELCHADLPKPPTDDTTDRWVTRELIPALRGICETINLKRDDDGEYEMQLIVVANRRVYEIQGNCGWVRNSTGVYAIGSGTAFALGALSAGATVSEALEIAAKHDPYTGYKLSIQSV
jgi:ATP-dependent protease HslVU (ClpYQ) peptidase subunit